MSCVAVKALKIDDNHQPEVRKFFICVVDVSSPRTKQKLILSHVVLNDIKLENDSSRLVLRGVLYHRSYHQAFFGKLKK